MSTTHKRRRGVAPVPDDPVRLCPDGDAAACDVAPVAPALVRAVPARSSGRRWRVRKSPTDTAARRSTRKTNVSRRVAFMAAPQHELGTRPSGVPSWALRRQDPVPA